MSENVYLSKFEAQNFRNLGEVELSIPPSAGVVVLEGPNGLGKTTWFEAIEVTLTGVVHRWQKLGEDQRIDVEPHLRRAGTLQSTPCEIRVEFSGSDSESLSAAWSLGGGGTHQAAVWLGADPGLWALTSANLSGFLRGTHFLPQSPHIRLLHLSEERRWEEVLRNVSGYSEITGLSEGLRSTSPQITQVMNERSLSHRQAQEALGAWRRRMASASAQQDAARTAGEALPPLSAIAVLDPADAPQGSWIESVEGARALLAALADVADAQRAERARIDEQRATATSLSGVPVLWAEAVAKAHVANLTLEAQRSREANARQQLAESSAAEGTAKLNLQQVEEEVRVLQKRGERSRALLEAERTLPDARVAVPPLQARRQTYQLEHEQAIRAEADVRARHERRRQWEEQREVLDARKDVLGLQEEAWSALQELEKRRGELNARHVEFLRLLEPKRVELASFEQELQGRQQAVVAADERARIAREAEGDIHALLASLAAHLRHHDTVCPLCLTEHAAPGVLLDRVAQAQARQSGALAKAEEDLRVARESAKSFGRKVGDFRGDVQRLEDRLKALLDERDGISREVDRLRSELPAAPQGLEAEALGILRVALEADISSHTANPSAALEPADVLSTQADEAIKVVQRCQGALTATSQALEEAESKVRKLDATAAEARRGLAAGTGVSAEVIATAIAVELATAEALRVDMVSSLQMSVAARETADQSVGEAVAATARANAEVQRALQDVADIEARWTSQNLALPPTADEVSIRLATLEATRSVLERRLSALGQASSGIERWVVLSTLHGELRALDEEADGHGPEAWHQHEARLEQGVEELRKAAQRAANARDEVARMSEIAANKRENMRRELDERLRQVLTPLLRSLIVNPEVADAVLQLTEMRRRTRVGASLGDGETPLLARVSEGQLAGVNLAVQLAMALAFPWSRWRAVLLDDPTQYSDILHSANLVETLRMFASQRGFQVFISTHEHDFARYVERKFLNDGLSARRLLFREPAMAGQGVVPRLLGGT